MRRFNSLVRHSNKNVILTGDTEWRWSVFLYAFQLVFGSFYFINQEHYWMGFAIPGLLSEGIICYTVLHKRGEANDLCRCDSETAQ